jgi:hypothetical protein
MTNMATRRKHAGRISMARHSTVKRTELAHRSGDGVDVTLFWVHEDGADRVVVSVDDRREGVSFEIPTEPYLALDVYYHPFVYRDVGTVEAEPGCVAA